MRREKCGLHAEGRPHCCLVLEALKQHQAQTPGTCGETRVLAAGPCHLVVVKGSAGLNQQCRWQTCLLAPGLGLTQHHQHSMHTYLGPAWCRHLQVLGGTTTCETGPIHVPGPRTSSDLPSVTQPGMLRLAEAGCRAHPPPCFARPGPTPPSGKSAHFSYPKKVPSSNIRQEELQRRQQNSSEPGPKPLPRKDLPIFRCEFWK